MNKTIKRILLGMGSLVMIFGISYGIYQYNKPTNLYERAVNKTEKQNKSHIKNTLISTGDLEELTSQSIDYLIDKKDKVIQVKKTIEGSNETSELLLVKDKVYVKTDDYYVDFANSEYLNSITDNLLVEGNSSYDEFQKALYKNVNKDTMRVEKEVKKIDGKDTKLKVLYLTIEKEKSKEIISSYIEKEYLSDLDLIVNETVKSQVEMSKSADIKFSEEDINKLKTELRTLLEKRLKEKISTIQYSDISIKLGVDSSGLIRYKEENYTLSIEGKENSIQSTTEYLDFGSSVEVTDPTKVTIKSLDEAMNEKKEEKKEEYKDYALENPDKNVSLSDVDKEKKEDSKKEEK